MAAKQSGIERLWETPRDVAVSAAVWSGGVVSMGLGAAVAAPLVRFMPYARIHRRVTAPAMTACIKLTTTRFDVIYDPAFDPERRSVFCQNHVNLLDGHTASAAIPHPFCGVMEAWQFRIPIYGDLMRISEGIPVHPRRAGRTAELTAAARDRAARGLSILVFPEAHRTVDGRVREFKRGMYFMARDAGLPVVPIAVRGMYAVNRKGTFRIHRGPVTVYVGRQYETAGLDEAGIRALAAGQRELIADFVERGRLPEAAATAVRVRVPETRPTASYNRPVA